MNQKASTAGGPFWSVIIPTYNPRRDYLEQAIRSVLDQSLDPSRTQVEVVDDCSPDVDVSALVSSIAGSRAAFSQTPKNLGLAGCWNTCIDRAGGEWIHILHQDDWVLPGFYERFENLFAAVPALGAAFCRYLFGDEEGAWTRLGDLHMRHAGELKNFQTLIATAVSVQCAAVVVKRTTYDTVGKYRLDLPYTLDWEMWCRIAALFPWGYVPELGAAYREHSSSETKRLQKAGKAFHDLFRGGRLGRAHLPKAIQEATEAEFVNRLVHGVYNDALALYATDRLTEAKEMIASFNKEALGSKYRREWKRLKLKVASKPLRNILRRS